MENINETFLLLAATVLGHILHQWTTGKNSPGNHFGSNHSHGTLLPLFTIFRVLTTLLITSDLASPARQMGSARQSNQAKNNTKYENWTPIYNNIME